jgi:SsrA-binding protein
MKQKKKSIFMRLNSETIAYNKSINFHYEVLEEIEVGIVLLGSEVKSLRINNPNFNDSYASFINNELFIKNLHIPILKYSYNNSKTHIPDTQRKLLLHKNEILRLQSKLLKGLTLIPSAIYFNKRGFIKIKIALAKGKKLFDKRQDLKEKDIKRNIAKDLKEALNR